MEMTMSDDLTTDIAGVRDSVGSHLGYTRWREVTQDEVNPFADMTNDHRFIHVDPERARGRGAGARPVAVAECLIRFHA